MCIREYGQSKKHPEYTIYQVLVSLNHLTNLELLVFWFKEESWSTAFLAINQSINERSIGNLLFSRNIFFKLLHILPSNKSHILIMPNYNCYDSGLGLRHAEVNQSHFTLCCSLYEAIYEHFPSSDGIANLN